MSTPASPAADGLDAAAAVAHVVAAVDAIPAVSAPSRMGLGGVARRFTDVTAALRTALDAVRELATVVGQAMQASQSDRTALHKSLDDLTARQPRSAPAVAATAVTTVLTTVAIDVALVWSSPWPDTSYVAVAWLETPATLLGRTSCVVKAKTKTGCTVTVTTSAALAAGAVTVRAISVTG